MVISFVVNNNIVILNKLAAGMKLCTIIHKAEAQFVLRSRTSP